MTVKYIHSLCCCASFCLAFNLSAQDARPIGAPAAIANLKNLLLAENGQDAIPAGMKLTNAVQADIKAHPPASFESTVAFKSAKPSPPAAHLKDLVPLLAKVDASWSQGSLILARDYSMALETAIGETAQAQRPSASKIFADLERQASDVTGFKRYLALPALAAAAFKTGELAKADAYSSELLAANEKYAKTGAWGEGVFYGNLVKGELEMAKGNAAGAATYLLAAGRTTGSPHLDSFGPNMSLALDLLKKGQTKAVLDYLELCALFWKTDYGALSRWKAAIQAGTIPDFGANLNY